MFWFPLFTIYTNEIVNTSNELEIAPDFVVVVVMVQKVYLFTEITVQTTALI